MIPTILYKKNIDKNQIFSEEISNSVYSVCSSERTSIAPGQRKNIRTFLELKIPKGYYGYVFPIKEKIIKHGLYTFPEFIDSEKFFELNLFVWNINTPTSPLFMNDKERFFGDKNKIDIFIGDKLAYLSLVPAFNFEIKELIQ